ncbi:hypothetical protein GQ61_00775 [Candidatus Nucleicultrix amoebiphila FS5]|uniref:Uncharacterized protein n=1 Tax=Candidatus Nucleicultrix amoebiphila FS5 TaxID=1414854 RepID=A0A1W6N2M0_9PROT|nr:hypothetical protein GQ61_00775 [Candidatus Nucleicultrix amoebiphila FS5]
MLSIHPFYYLIASLIFACGLLFRSRFDKAFFILFIISFSIGLYKLFMEPIADFPLFFAIIHMFTK